MPVATTLSNAQLIGIASVKLCTLNDRLVCVIVSESIICAVYWMALDVRVVVSDCDTLVNDW